MSHARRLMTVRPWLVLVVLIAGCSPAPKAGVPVVAPPVHSAREVTVAAELVRDGRIVVASAERRALRGELVLVGEVMAGEDGEADVSTLVQGRVAELTVGEGQRVRRGQVLAWIDAPEVGRATAELLRARSRAKVAARQLQRQLQLDREQATSDNAVDEARAAEAAAGADLLAARTLLASVGGTEPSSVDANAPVSVRIPVRAPIDGTVVRRNVLVGGPVAPDKPLFHLVSTDRAYVRARLPETAPVLAEGTLATLRPREASAVDNARCAARVTANFRWVDETRTVPLRLAPVGPCPALVVGRYVDVLVATTAAVGSGVVVPKEASVEVRGATVVFVQTSQSAFVARAVRLGASTATEVVVEAGVEPGDHVVVKGAILLKGELIRGELETP